MRIPGLHLLKRSNGAVDERTDLYQSLVSAFWDGVYGGAAWSPRLIDRVWVAERCIQLNAQQIASMPLRHYGGVFEPAWVASPDPVWFPNGIADAVAAIVWSIYAWGDAYLLVTSRYANGLPSGWTVVEPSGMSVTQAFGRRRYRYGSIPLDADDVVQISRNPRGALTGTSALSSYANENLGLMAASELSRTLMGEGAIPNTLLQSKKRLDEDQAKKVQSQWTNRAATRKGAPAIIPPELEPVKWTFSPQDLLLLDAQSFDARAIASAMGTPAFMVNLPLEGGLTYQSPAMLGEHWWRFELRPIAGLIARALSGNMLPRGQAVAFDAREVLAPGFKELVDAWVSLAKEGFVTPEELRAAVLRLTPGADAIEALTTPPSAGASPAQQPTAQVVELRPGAGIG